MKRLFYPVALASVTFLAALSLSGSLNFFIPSWMLPRLQAVDFNLMPAAQAQIPSVGDAWKQVYQKLPDFPKENQYLSKETGQPSLNNTLASRMIRYHIYVKGRPPFFRLDWKLTLADYLGVNEFIEDASYPGRDALQSNPVDGDRAAVQKLNRAQRDALVQVLVELFNPGAATGGKAPASPKPTPSPSPAPVNPGRGSADLLK
ncbi:hypothetical protein BST81_04580 [Leptolyngbya sp. 'hensonii']|nr:hypothetical protein BST81_04580 [Leptolyngbya sp. 'hensonii']